MADREGAPSLNENNSFRRITGPNSPVDPIGFFGGLANPKSRFRAVMIAGRFVCLEAVR